MKIRYLAKSFLQDYKISYVNERQHPTKSHFTGLLNAIYK